MHRKLQLSPRLIQQIREGKAILFLGAGASYGCKSADGAKNALTGRQLGEALSNEFLGGRRANEPLARIADYASTDSSVLEVQHFIRNAFDSINPLDFHQIIPRFKWKAIVTTNYDRVVEKAYEKVKERLQDPLVLVRDGDIRAYENEANAVPIFKIHGCINNASDTKLPLIIANEQYAKYRDGRGRLITAFQEMAKDYPVIFCGYELGDAHIAQILFSLEEGFQDRPSYAAINPRFDEHDRRYWAKYKMDAIPGTFEEFLRTIDKEVPPNQRVLGQLFTGSMGSISRWIKVNATLSHSLQAVMAGRLLHVHHDMPVENPNPSKFYRGDSTSWAPIKHNFDFPRRVTYGLVTGLSRLDKGTEFLLVNGHAGSGKSVVLKRAAWELAGDASPALCFYCDNSLKGVKEVLQELYEVSGERIFIFVDNALFDIASLNDCYSYAEKTGLPVTFICGARTNEWNTAHSGAKFIQGEEYTVGDLSHNEAGVLCNLLEKHDCLGELRHIPPTERVERLMQLYERQLLVALHEATMGSDIRKILRDEYRNITPPEAQVLYLDICSLHRLNIPVRAGLISRMSGTGFHQFEDRFFRPLEKVVTSYSDWRSKDFAYRTRHTEIAQIVFEEAFPTPADKADQIARVVHALNTDYSSDDDAATLLLRGRVMADEFADRSLADRIFDAAEQSGVDRSFLLQQRAIFELRHPGGSAARAQKYIDEAIASGKRSTGILHHTKAVVLRELSREEGIDPVLAERYREAALNEIKDHGLLKSSKHGVVTYCEVLLDQITLRMDEDSSNAPKLSEEVAIRKMGELERNLAEGLQRWPDDTYLMGVRTNLYGVLSKHPQALAMLRSAFQRGPGNEFVALRLSRQLIDSEETAQVEEGKAVLRKSVSLNPSSKALSYQLAKVLMREDEVQNAGEISKLLRRSFTDGDTHFEAQFWSARHEFLYGDRQKGLAMYAQFKAVPVPYVDSSERRGIVKDRKGIATDFEGTVRSLKGDFGFVDCSALSGSIFLHSTQLRGSGWQDLRPGDRLKFKVAFSFRGPCCVDAHI
jgi:cold shock CspA family protein